MSLLEAPAGEGRRDQHPALVPTIGLALVPVAALAVAPLPIPEFSRDAQLLAAILTLVVVYWVTEALPLPVTALGGVPLAVLLGVTPAGVAIPAPASAHYAWPTRLMDIARL